jgi:hypothetical protein
VGVLSSFTHCAEAFSTLHHDENSTQEDLTHLDQESNKTCCDDPEKEPLSISGSNQNTRVTLTVILPEPTFEVILNKTPQALPPTIQVKDPPRRNQTLLAINTIRLLL